jgi:DNA-binding SARP family transcriptional activator
MVSQDELMDVFFDRDIVDNPGSSVRTMIYRARSILSENGLLIADDVIVSTGGGYTWNNEIRCIVDTEEFEALCKRASSTTDLDKRLDYLLQATALFRGDFLPNSSGEIWVIPLARWYRSLYFNCVHEALKLLTEAKRNNEIEELCIKSQRIDPFDEIILEYLLRSLLSNGKETEALSEYKRMESMFYNELDVEFSENLRALYKTITNRDVKERTTLDETLKEWLDDADDPGAYACDLSVFKTVCRIEARTASRSGRATYIVRIDAKHEPDAKGGGVMAQLHTVIEQSLRKGDLFTRSSPGQYMLMLNKLTYENCNMLVDRILYSLDSKYLSKIIGTSVRPITPLS